MTTYAESGVDIDLEGDVSKILYNAAKRTWENRKGRLGEVVVPFDDFSGVRAIDVSNLPKGTLMNINFDGVGTKAELAQRVGDHRTMAFDLFAMVCDDAVVRGAEPVLVGSILDVNTLFTKGGTFIEQVKQLAEGYVNAAKEANVAIVNGELAELGSAVSGYGPFNYNWGSAVVWFAKKERMFTGRELKAGDVLVGLQEEGFRSNGLSLARKVLESAHGKDWHIQNENLAKQALHPSRIYCSAVCEMFGGFDREPKAEVRGVAHITGGGIPEKVGRMLKPSGLGAVIDSPFEPSPLMKYCQEAGKIEDREAYRAWNMGQGMVVASPEPESVMKIAKHHNIGAKIIGKITAESGIRIRNMGFFSKSEMLKF
ncbi:MAG: AIR synthase-related protein [Candidatus Aenigmatarchaeota archaeon]